MLTDRKKELAVVISITRNSGAGQPMIMVRGTYVMQSPTFKFEFLFKSSAEKKCVKFASKLGSYFRVAFWSV